MLKNAIKTDLSYAWPLLKLEGQDLCYFWFRGKIVLKRCLTYQVGYLCLGPKKYQKIARMYDRATRYASDCKNRSDLPYQEHSTPEADIPGYINWFKTLLHQHFIDIVGTFWHCHVRRQSFVTLRSLRFSSIPSPFLPKFLNVHNILGHVFENVQVFQFFMPFRMVCSVLSEGGFWS